MPNKFIPTDSIAKVVISIGTLGLLCLMLPGSLRADPVTYTYTGVGIEAGTDFSYVSPSGFLSYGSTVIPTTSTDFIFNFDLGAIESVDFLSANEIDVNTTSGGWVLVDSVTPYDISTAGSYVLGYSALGGQYLLDTDVGTLVISTVTDTPEPSVGLLMLIGIGFLLVMRKRIARSLRASQPV